MPSSYFSQILNRWNQYLSMSENESYVTEIISLLQVHRKLAYAQPLVDSIWRVVHLAQDVL
jgi:hypothetical protein